MSEQDPESQNTTDPEPDPEPMEVDAPTFDYIEKSDDQGDLETRDRGDTEHK